MSQTTAGKDGATYTFGRQKVNPRFKTIWKLVCNTDIIKEHLTDLDMDIPGSGAAMVRTALMVFLNGTLKLELRWYWILWISDEHLKDVDIVVTGEGATDWQSVFGKVA